MAVATGPEVARAGWAVRQGLIGGAIAGIVFALAGMVGSVLMGMPILMPFQSYASLALGIPPMDIQLGTAIPVGTVAHMLLSIIYGVMFALAVQNIQLLRTSRPVTIVAAIVFGITLWFVNFNVLAVPLGRPWFAMAPPIPQFISHAIFFGLPLGLYLASRLPRAR
ncbi:MAG: hypothetical protein M3395_01790 [Chloroflexota bacterium]|nr:hypothetical protein [Chloroflexota bacterium]